ncbi:hypothetical protein HYV58_01140 [Candidatus Peregrinibacteria bacterium]|nr:hypothetical protein [Candidatus Peregrinibacteria bacterium]
MLSKIFAVFISFIFTLSAFLLLLFWSLLVFFDKTRVQTMLIPQSYEPVIGLIAGAFASNEPDKLLFKKRIFEIFREETYIRLLTEATNPMYASLDDRRAPLAMDLRPLKMEAQKAFANLVIKLPPCGPEEISKNNFRLCRPSTLPADQDFARTASLFLTNEIPDTINLEKKLPPHVGTVLTIIVFSILWLGLFSAARAFRWMGSNFLIITALLLGSMTLLRQLKGIIAADENLNAMQSRLLEVFSSLPREALEICAWAVSMLGVLFLAVSYLLKRYKAAQKTL